MTSQGHSRTVFRRALEPGNLLIAEATVREIRHVDLWEALELTALIAQHGSLVLAANEGHASSASQVTAKIVWITSAVSCQRDTSKQSTPIALTG